MVQPVILFLNSNLSDNSNQVMKSLWDLEGVGIRQDEVKVSEHPLLEQFRDNVSYANGRYEVVLPWVSGKALQSSNLLTVERRYLQLEKKSYDVIRNYANAIGICLDHRWLIP